MEEKYEEILINKISINDEEKEIKHTCDTEKYFSGSRNMIRRAKRKLLKKICYKSSNQDNSESYLDKKNKLLESYYYEKSNSMSKSIFDNDHIQSVMQEKPSKISSFITPFTRYSQNRTIYLDNIQKLKALNQSKNKNTNVLEVERNINSKHDITIFNYSRPKADRLLSKNEKYNKTNYNFSNDSFVQTKRFFNFNGNTNKFEDINKVAKAKNFSFRDSFLKQDKIIKPDQKLCKNSIENKFNDQNLINIYVKMRQKQSKTYEFKHSSNDIQDKQLSNLVFESQNRIENNNNLIPQLNILKDPIPSILQKSNSMKKFIKPIKLSHNSFISLLNNSNSTIKLQGNNNNNFTSLLNNSNSTIKLQGNNSSLKNDLCKAKENNIAKFKSVGTLSMFSENSNDSIQI